MSWKDTGLHCSLGWGLRPRSWSRATWAAAARDHGGFYTSSSPHVLRAGGDCLLT